MPNSEHSILLASLKLKTPAEREAYLKVACAGDQVLFANVQALLAALNKSDSPPDVSPVVETIAFRPNAEVLGSQIGPYKLLQQIGEGGMGVVYMAEQSKPIKRVVALKVIKPGMDTGRYNLKGRVVASPDYANTLAVADALLDTHELDFRISWR